MSVSVRLWGREPSLVNPLILWSSSSKSRGEVNLDLTGLEFVCPLDLVGLAAWGSSLSPARRGEILLPESDGVASYLERMNVLAFLREAGWSVPPAPTGPRQPLLHKLLELRRLADYGAVEELADRLPRLLAGKSSDPRRMRALHFAFGELCDNAISHSGASPIFVAAQRYSGKTSHPPPRLELAVADIGVGIPDHLRRNPRYEDVSDDAEAISLALRPGVTGTRDRRGWGFHDVLAESEDVAEGQMLVLSGRGGARVPFGREGARRRFWEIEKRLPGTWIQIQFHERD